MVILTGLVAAGVSGYLVIRFLLRFLANHPRDVFAYYRFVLTGAVLALVAHGVRQ